MMCEETLSYQQQFATLGIAPTTELTQVSSAYRKCASQFHPDVVACLGADAQQIAKQRMIEINNAYDHLKRFLATNPDLSVDAPTTEPRPTQKKHTAPKATRKTTPEAQVRFQCPHCQRGMRVPVSLRGKSGTCSACREQIVVPTHDIICCDDCGNDNSVPNVMMRKKAICWKCFSDLPGRAMS